MSHINNDTFSRVHMRLWAPHGVLRVYSGTPEGPSTLLMEMPAVDMSSLNRPNDDETMRRYLAGEWGEPDLV